MFCFIRQLFHTRVWVLTQAEEFLGHYIPFYFPDTWCSAKISMCIFWREFVGSCIKQCLGGQKWCNRPQTLPAPALTLECIMITLDACRNANSTLKTSVCRSTGPVFCILMLKTRSVSGLWSICEYIMRYLGHRTQV